MDKITRVKTLRSYTIIPSELYVERSADVHLQQSIIDMGRPGYILVARQMGKTNLLLHTKRRLSNSLDKFLYIDVSNIFLNSRLFFQNIINTFFDTYPEIDAEIPKLIWERRNIVSPLPPHKEHENELRHIIRSLRGKLVICLDEIDAITNTDYSDQVFAFIRSVYFSGRENFTEFERLTYVLSGVAEPSELIRNKALSPFNIGEKIYLDDFSREEFNIFLKKAQLTFNDDVIERVYYWTNGNPRLCWETCAALEDYIISGNQITAEVVDSLITEMYLTNFDLPPIDHIRTLVEEDRIVRDAIMAIHYGKSEAISDAVRNRLYLSGITKPNQKDRRKVVIRNPLLEISLSEKWIQDIERRKIPIYELANKQYGAGKYKEALELYEEYIESTHAPEEPEFLYSRIGHCLLKLERFHDAIRYFENHPIKNEKSPLLYYSTQYWQGLAHLLSGKHLKSAEFFNRILEQDINSTSLYFYFGSCLNLSTVLSIGPVNNLMEIRRLNQIVVDSESLVRGTAEEEYYANHLLTIAHHNLAKVSRETGDIESARSSIKSAIQVADERTQVLLFIEASDIAASREEKIQILELCVQNIRDKRIAVRAESKEYPLDFTLDVCAKLVVRLLENTIDQGLDKLILHLANNDMQHEVSVGDVLLGAAFTIISTKSNPKSVVKLVTKAIELPTEEMDSEIRRQLLIMGIFSTPLSEAEPLIDKYWCDYIESADARLVEPDFRLAWIHVHQHFSSGKLSRAGVIIAQIRDLMEKTWAQIPDESDFDQLTAKRTLFDALDLELELRQGRGESFLKRTEELLSRLNNMQTFNLPYFPEEFFNQLRSRVQSFIAPSIRSESTVRRVKKKYGRNNKIKVRFEDGRIEEGKYKHFETRLNNGHCQVIDD
jgi:tetratricopeptide (TPR) repeat protein